MTGLRKGSVARRLAGLGSILAGIGIVVAARTASGQAGGHQLALGPAQPVLPTEATTGPTTTSTPANTPTSQGAAVPVTSSAPPPPATPAGPHTVPGSAVDTPYGTVQVAVVFTGGRITDVRTLQTPTDADRSIRLAALATPILRQEVLSAQSAQVDSVSGATYTSQGYAQSVQYAIDHRNS